MHNRKRAAWLIAIAALWATPVTAQQDLPKATAQAGPLLVSADMRQGTDLSGAWHYSIDPYRSGLAGFHGGTPDVGQQRYRDVDVRAEMARDSRVLYEFDLAHSPVTSLPSSWLTQAPELRYYQGLMWYQRSFPVPAQRKTGMGTQLLRRQRGLKAVEVEFRPAGLTCRIVIEGVYPSAG